MHQKTQETVSAQIFKAKKQAIFFSCMYVISNFSLFLLLNVQHSVLKLSVELNFIIIAVYLAKLANFSCSIMAYAVTAGIFGKI